MVPGSVGTALLFRDSARHVTKAEHHCQQEVLGLPPPMQLLGRLPMVPVLRGTGTEGEWAWMPAPPGRGGSCIRGPGHKPSWAGASHLGRGKGRDSAQPPQGLRA